jgi:serine/threonine protein kinase
MELCNGTLKKFIENRTPSSQAPITMTEILNIMAQIASGVAFIHEQGEVHRDIKPENSMLPPHHRR